MRFDRHNWNKEYREQKKLLAKAIRQHKKRSHIRERLRELGNIKLNQLYGGMSQCIRRAFKKKLDRVYNDTIAPSPFAKFFKEGKNTEFPVPLRFKK